MLTSLREKIDEIDDCIVKLLNERAKVSLSIGETKRSSKGNEDGKEDHHVYIPGREKKVFEKVAGLNQGPLSDSSVQAIYREIMSASISLQKKVVVGFLGPLGTFTYQAAVSRFGDSVQYISADSIQDAFDLMCSGKVTYCVVPIENSSNGVVTETLDQMILNRGNFKIRAETFLHIEHCLLTSNAIAAATASSSSESLGVDGQGSCSDDYDILRDVERIYSHEQAFGQCRKWISNYSKKHHREIEQICVKSTAQAAKQCANDPKSAAIAPFPCAEIHGLAVIARSIQDNVKQASLTRFMVLANASDEPTGEDKTLLCFTTDNQSGSLCQALNVFQVANVNITLLSSRPTRVDPWSYYFILELEGHSKDSKLEKAIDELGTYTNSIYIFGSYPNSVMMKKQ